MIKERLQHFYSQLRRIAPLFLCVFLLSSCAANKILQIELIKEWLNVEMSYTTSDFWGSQAMSMFFKMFNTVYMDGFDVLSSAALKLMVIGFALWLAFFTLRLVGALNAPSAADYLNAVFKHGFVVLCFAVFLGNPNYLRWLLNHTAVLVIGAFAGTAVDIMNTVLSSMMSTSAVYTDTVTSAALAGLGESTDANHLEAIGEVFSAVLLACHKQLLFGIAYGKLVKTLSDGVINKLAGSFMIILFSIVDFMIPLFLMDGMFKFMIAMIMSPLFCAAWVFPATRQYVKKAWPLVIGMGFQILFTVVYICIAVSCVRAFTMKHPLLSFLLDAASFSNGVDFEDVIKGIDQASSSAFSLAVCGIFMMLIADKMSSLSNNFTGSPASAIFSETAKAAWEKIKEAIKLAVLVLMTMTGVGGVYASKKLSDHALKKGLEGLKKMKKKHDEMNTNSLSAHPPSKKG